MGMLGTKLPPFSYHQKRFLIKINALDLLVIDSHVSRLHGFILFIFVHADAHKR
jgi:hypothetical protein